MDAAVVTDTRVVREMADRETDRVEVDGASELWIGVCVASEDVLEIAIRKVEVDQRKVARWWAAAVHAEVDHSADLKGSVDEDVTRGEVAVTKDRGRAREVAGVEMHEVDHVVDLGAGESDRHDDVAFGRSVGDEAFHQCPPVLDGPAAILSRPPEAWCGHGVETAEGVAGVLERGGTVGVGEARGCVDGEAVCCGEDHHGAFALSGGHLVDEQHLRGRDASSTRAAIAHSSPSKVGSSPNRLMRTNTVRSPISAR